MASVEKAYELDIGVGIGIDSDAEDDEITQDWSEAAKLSKKATSSSLPKRGEKDYEPDGTNVQELLLYRARNAMFETLANSARGTVLSNQIKAYYVPAMHEAVIPQPKGSFLQTMGKSDTHGKCWLQLHEFVYLAERGTVTPYYSKSFPILSANQDQDIEIPLSMQDLYSLFKSQEEMDQFFVYSHLKRLGFIVHVPDEDTLTYTSFYAPPTKYNILSSMHVMIKSLLYFWDQKKRWVTNSFFYSKWNYKMRKYTSSIQIYRGLNNLIPFVAPPKTSDALRSERFNSSMSSVKSKWPIALNVWKPQTSFKKKSPGLPNFQVVIYNKNHPNQHFPTYSDFRAIFHSLDYKFQFLSGIEDDVAWNEHCYTNGSLRSEYLISSNSRASRMKSGVKDKLTPAVKKSKEISVGSQHIGRLKRGYRSFLLAVMDDGLISFVKISEADFGSEDVWYVPTVPRGKGTKGHTKKRHVRENKFE